MTTISVYLATDHHHCDDLFAKPEESVANGEWCAAIVHAGQFVAAMNHHFGMEENIVFPAFEQATGFSNGPTWVMRGEHDQMREVLNSMISALTEQNADKYLGLSETLLIVMQQHNLKEEHMLYPMIDNALLAERSTIVERLQADDKVGV